MLLGRVRSTLGRTIVICSEVCFAARSMQLRTPARPLLFIDDAELDQLTRRRQ